MKKAPRNLAPSFSYKSSTGNYTGSWRFIKPLYQNKLPPCNLGCPNTNDIQGFIAAINSDNLKEAFTILTRTTPFPAICGRVCYHPCETNCNRLQYDDAVNICALERVVGDYALEQKLSLITDENGIAQDTKKKIAIIGSGPAGLNCAYHLRRMGHEVTIFESRSKAGGMLRHGIPEFRLPKQVLDGEIHRLLDLGITINYNSKINKKELEHLSQNHDAVFMAIGAYQPKDVAIKGSDLTGVTSGLNFLLAHAYDSETSRFNVKGKRVIVVGGGNTALDTARTVLRLGGLPTIYYRRTQNEMPAHPDEIREALEEGISIEFLVNPIECRGKNGGLSSVTFQRMQLGEKDSSGRQKAIPLEGKNFEVNADFLFTAFGEDAEMGDLAIPLENKWGRFIKKEHFKSNMKNVFLGGDAVQDTQGTVVYAMGEGQKAAKIIHQFLAGVPFATAQLGQAVGYDDLNRAYFQKSPRHKTPERSQAERKTDFLPVIHALPKNNYQREAQRCFSCGVCNYCRNCELFCPDKSVKFKMDGLIKSLTIDYDHCKGCGICVYECPRCAMDMAKES